jgi:hypothetical protein
VERKTEQDKERGIGTMTKDDLYSHIVKDMYAMWLRKDELQGVAIYVFYDRHGKPVHWTTAEFFGKLAPDWMWQNFDPISGRVAATVTEKLARRFVQEGRKPDAVSFNPFELKKCMDNYGKIVKLYYFLDEEDIKWLLSDDGDLEPIDVARFQDRPEGFGLKNYNGKDWSLDEVARTSLNEAWKAWKVTSDAKRGGEKCQSQT